MAVSQDGTQRPRSRRDAFLIEVEATLAIERADLGEWVLSPSVVILTQAKAVWIAGVRVVLSRTVYRVFLALARAAEFGHSVEGGEIAEVGSGRCPRDLIRELRIAIVRSGLGDEWTKYLIQEVPRRGWRLAPLARIQLLDLDTSRLHDDWAAFMRAISDGTPHTKYDDEVGLGTADTWRLAPQQCATPKIVIRKRAKQVFLDGVEFTLAPVPFQVLLLLAEAASLRRQITPAEIERALGQREAKDVMRDLRDALLKGGLKRQWISFYVRFDRRHGWRLPPASDIVLRD